MVFDLRCFDAFLIQGMEADLALLELLESPDKVNGFFGLEDSQAQMRPCKERLVARAVWKAGQRGRITQAEEKGRTEPVTSLSPIDD